MSEKVKRTSISLPADLMADAEERMRSLRYRNFSDYIAYLISADVFERPAHTTIRDEGQIDFKRGLGSRLNESPSKKKA